MINAKFAVIGGSGAYQLLKSKVFGDQIECQSLKTPFGISAPIHLFSIGKLHWLFLSRHGEEDYSITAPYVNYRANIYALKECGVERILSWSGPGIINSTFQPGEFVLPHDIIDETRKRETTFFKGRGHGFIRQNEPFCPQIKNTLHHTLHDKGVPHQEQGVYVCTEGPRLESPAEIRKYRILGADLVGMTLIPEVFLARELEICYTPICYLTNFAEGVVRRVYQKGKRFEGMQTSEESRQVQKAIKQFPNIICTCWLRLIGTDRSCHCKDAMLRYKKKGTIGNDWHLWVGEV